MEEMELMKLKNVICWIGVIGLSFFALCALVTGAFFSAILFCLACVIIMPIKAIKELRCKLKLNKAKSICLIVVFFIVGCVVLPTTEPIVDGMDSTHITEDTENNNSDFDDTVDMPNNVNDNISDEQEADSDKENNSITSINSNADSRPVVSDKNEINSSKPTVSGKPQAPTNNNQQNISNTVYITNTGKKYHSYKSCPGLARAKTIIESTLSSAKSSGLTACSKCH